MTTLTLEQRVKRLEENKELRSFKIEIVSELKTFFNLKLNNELKTLDTRLGGRMTFLQWSIGLGLVFGFGGISVLIAIGTGMFN